MLDHGYFTALFSIPVLTVPYLYTKCIQLRGRTHQKHAKAKLPKTAVVFVWQHGDLSRDREEALYKMIA